MAIRKKLTAVVLASFAFATGMLAFGNAIAANSNEHAVHTVVLAADRWCPFNCDINADPPGFAVEMARESFAMAGWKLEYRVMPWARAVDAAQAGRIDGVIGTLVKNVPDFVFPKELVGRDTSVFFIRSDSEWRYRGLHTLDDVVLGVANEYLFGDPFDDYVARFRNDPNRVVIIYSQNPVKQGLDLLEAGRIGTYVDNRLVVNWALRKQPRATAIREFGQLNDDPLYIAFSPKRSDAKATADAFDKGVRALRESGRLAEILSRYGVSDWGPARLVK